MDNKKEITEMELINISFITKNQRMIPTRARQEFVSNRKFVKEFDKANMKLLFSQPIFSRN